LDIFGDPVINPKKWPLVSFSNIGEFKSGGTPSKENSLYWIGSFPWISPKDMKRDYINDSIDHISDIVFQKTSLKKIDPKSILIVIRGMILAHSFPVAINNVPVAINQDMKAIIPSPKYKSEYLLICLKLMKNLILQYVSTAAHGTKKINADSLRKIMIPCPQLSIQIEFIKLTHKLGIIRLELEKERNQIKNLFDSIVQKVFKGELSFNIDFELDALLKEVDFNKIKSDKVYLQRLVDRLKEQEFQNKEIYDTAKTILFKLLKEGDLVTQEYNDTLKSISLVS
jgi:type I restriction enzyme S subunit